MSINQHTTTTKITIYMFPNLLEFQHQFQIKKNHHLNLLQVE